LQHQQLKAIVITVNIAAIIPNIIGTKFNDELSAKYNAQNIIIMMAKQFIPALCNINCDFCDL